MWYLSSLSRDHTWAMAVEVLSANHWATREFLVSTISYVLPLGPGQACAV